MSQLSTKYVLPGITGNIKRSLDDESDDGICHLSIYRGIEYSRDYIGDRYAVGTPLHIIDVIDRWAFNDVHCAICEFDYQNLPADMKKRPLIVDQVCGHSTMAHHISYDIIQITSSVYMFREKSFNIWEEREFCYIYIANSLQDIHQNIYCRNRTLYNVYLNIKTLSAAKILRSFLVKDIVEIITTYVETHNASRFCYLLDVKNRTNYVAKSMK